MMDDFSSFITFVKTIIKKETPLLILLILILSALKIIRERKKYFKVLLQRKLSVSSPGDDKRPGTCVNKKEMAGKGWGF